MSEGETVCVKKGISTLLEANKKREDDKWQQWAKLEAVQYKVTSHAEQIIQDNKCNIAATKRKQLKK